MQTRQYYVYIAANEARTLYIGVTNDLPRRMFEHRHRLTPGFTSKYGIDKLIYFEATPDVRSAIERGNHSRAGCARGRSP